MIHIVDPAGALLPGHPIDPMLWDAAPASEPLLELDRLDAQRLAVLVSRGADNEYSAYGGVLEFDVSPARPERSGGPPSSKASSSTTRRGPSSKPFPASRSR